MQGRDMSLDIWFRADVERALDSQWEHASQLSGDFRRGYEHALRCVALTFGIRYEGGDCYDGPLASTVTPAERRQREE